MWETLALVAILFFWCDGHESVRLWLQGRRDHKERMAKLENDRIRLLNETTLE